MSRDYGRIHSAFWTDAKVRSFSDDARLLAAYLLSCPHSNMLGAFLLPDAYIVDDLGWDMPRVTKTLGELSDAGFAQRFADKRHVVLCNYLKWNRFENPNVTKSAARQAIKLPVSDPAFEHVRRGFEAAQEWVPEDLREHLLKPYRKGFENGSGRVSEGLSKQEPEPESQPEPEQEPQPEREPQPQPKARKRALPAARFWGQDEHIPPEWRAEAAELRKRHSLSPIDVELVAERFEDYWRTRDDAKAKKADWHAAWRNHVTDPKFTHPAPRVALIRGQGSMGPA